MTPATETDELLQRLERFVARYVVLGLEAERAAVALWTAHTWAIQGAHQTPYLLVLSPEKRSGKTRLLEVLEMVAARPWRVTAASEAAMFRKLATDPPPTLLLDEVDAIFASHSERTEPLRAILNSGNRPGAAVARCVGQGEKRVEDFSVYSPKVLAGIDTGRVPDTIRDRAITIRMQRKARGEQVQPFRVRHVEREAVEVLEWLEDWSAREHERLYAAEPRCPSQLGDRAADAWEPLLAIADLAGGKWPALARAAAVALSGGEDTDEASNGTKALAGIRAALDGQVAMSSAELVNVLNQSDDLPFGGWRDGRGIDARSLARLLRPYGVGPRTVRLADGTAKGYRREQFTEPFARYLTEPSQASQPSQPSPHGNADVTAVTDVTATSGSPAVVPAGDAGPDVELGRITAKFGDDGLDDLGPERPLPAPHGPERPLPAARCRCDRPAPNGDRGCAKCGHDLQAAR